MDTPGKFLKLNSIKPDIKPQIIYSHTITTTLPVVCPGGKPLSHVI